MELKSRNRKKEFDELTIDEHHDIKIKLDELIKQNSNFQSESEELKMESSSEISWKDENINNLCSKVNELNHVIEKITNEKKELKMS